MLFLEGAESLGDAVNQRVIFQLKELINVVDKHKRHRNRNLKRLLAVFGINSSIQVQPAARSDGPLCRDLCQCRMYRQRGGKESLEVHRPHDRIDRKSTRLNSS